MEIVSIRDVQNVKKIQYKMRRTTEQNMRLRVYIETMCEGYLREQGNKARLVLKLVIEDDLVAIRVKDVHLACTPRLVLRPCEYLGFTQEDFWKVF